MKPDETDAAKRLKMTHDTVVLSSLCSPPRVMNHASQGAMKIRYEWIHVAKGFKMAHVTIVGFLYLYTSIYIFFSAKELIPFSTFSGPVLKHRRLMKEYMFRKVFRRLIRK